MTRLGLRSLLGSQVGSHSLWTCPDGCGRPWTQLGDLRIKRLGGSSPSGCTNETPARAGISVIRGFAALAVSRQETANGVQVPNRLRWNVPRG